MLKENNVPKLRFKDFEDEWGANLAKDLCEFSKGKGFSKNDLTNDGKPILLYGSMYTNFKNTLSSVKTFVNNIKIEACYSKTGDVVVPSSGETRDDIARATNIDANNIILGGDLNILHPNNELNSSFLSLSITYGKGHKRLSRLAQGNSVVHLYNSDLKTLKIVYPSVYEQQKIGSFFEKIDKIIELQIKNLEQLKKLKQGYLQKMFPQDGELVPRLRFSGFSDEWKKLSLNNIGTIVTGNTPSKKDKDNYGGNNLWITPSDIDSDSTYINDSVTMLSDRGKQISKIVPKDSILVTCIASIGKNALSNCELSINQQINALIPKENFDSYFLLNLSNQWSIEMNNLTSNASLKIINRTEFSKIETLVPEFEEQQKIGAFFSKLDQLINNQSKKIEALKQEKRFYLQKMFI
ncbi:restriction endonuclease subunit S [Apilactobacillus kunkeei]|uniref:restriction endonuclease subunit S n=1 Tax=Apilactobacillus kunkeei TaxID=148814 RepID=UPI0039E1BC11